MPGKADREDLSLNKRQVLSGIRCHKKLWLEFHEEHAPELQHSPETLVRFEEGRRTDEHARQFIGDGVQLAPGRSIDPETVAARTREAMQGGASVLFQPAFIGAGANIRADVMMRDDDRWTLIEVKSSKSPKDARERKKKIDEHLADVAVQAAVIRAAGVTLGASELMLLNRDCVHPDLSNLFVREDLTADANTEAAKVPAAVTELHRVLRGAQPDTPVGDQCTDPDECPFYDRCHDVVEPHHVSELYFAKKQAAKFEAAGKTMIAHLDESDAPNEPARRQVRAVKSMSRVVEPGLRAALGQLKSPVVYFDFETVQLAVPRWPGCRPQDMVAVQFSAHREGFADNETRSHLASRGGDPRPALIDAMVDACAGASTIVVYYEPFEKKRIEELAAWFPEREKELMAIHARIVDLLPIVRDHVYDPEFHGSFSLKKVLPALVPNLDYTDLAIQDGGAATAGIYRLLFDDSLDEPGQAALRADLLAYCHRDTEAMVELVKVLREMSK